MATDYDAPRRNEADELGEDSLEELKARRAEAQSASVDVDETDFNENLELPGADLSTRSSPSACCPSRRTSSPARAASSCSTAAGSPPPRATSCSAATAPERTTPRHRARAVSGTGP